MYSLKVKKGTKVSIRTRSGFNVELIGGKEYSQKELEAYFNMGFTHFVSLELNEEQKAIKTKKTK